MCLETANGHPMCVFGNNGHPMCVLGDDGHPMCVLGDEGHLDHVLCDSGPHAIIQRIQTGQSHARLMLTPFCFAHFIWNNKNLVVEVWSMYPSKFISLSPIATA
jgi:hypothetical protein